MLKSYIEVIEEISLTQKGGKRGVLKKKRSCFNLLGESLYFNLYLGHEPLAISSNPTE
ncbi:MAG: hypothetical protein RLZZ26_389 [Candidatus Parcubacteria bacterium]